MYKLYHGGLRICVRSSCPAIMAFSLFSWSNLVAALALQMLDRRQKMILEKFVADFIHMSQRQEKLEDFTPSVAN